MGFERDYREIPLTWERGMVELVEPSMLPIGAAPRLRNWEADPSGNLRARVPWSKGSTASAPSTRKGAGIGHLALQRRPYIVQRKSGTTATAAEPLAVSATWDAATTAGNCLVALIYMTDASSTRSETAITVTPPASWLEAVGPEGSARNAHAWIYYLPNAASQSGAVSFTLGVTAFSDSVALGLEIFEVANIAASPLDVVSEANNGTSTTQASGTTAAPAVPVGIAFAAFASADTTDNTYSSPTNDFTLTTEIYLDAASVDLSAVGAYHVYENGAAQSTSLTINNAPVNSGGVIACFKAADYTLTDGRYVVANDENPSIKIYAIDRDDVDGGTWSLLETITALVGGTPVAFTSGNQRLFYTHPAFTGTHAWDGLGTTPTVISGSPAGRCIAWHKNRLYVGGTNGEPWKLWYSEVGDDTVWNSGTASALEIGKGDGEAIEDVTPFQDSLLVAKQTSLWVVTGSGPDNFRVIRLPVGGAAPGRTVLATPNGAVVAGRASVWLVNGGSVEKISGPIRESYGLTGSWMTISFLDDQTYILDEGSGTIWAIDFSNSGTWREERIDSASTEAPAIIFNQDNRQLFSPKNASVGSILNFREIPGDARGKDFDTLTQTWEAYTPEIWPVGPEEKITPRYLFLKLRQRAGDAGDNAISFTPVYDGTAVAARTITPAATAGVRWHRLDIGDNVSGKGVSSVQIRISHTLDSTETAVFDIEEMTLGFNVEPVV